MVFNTMRYLESLIRPAIVLTLSFTWFIPMLTAQVTWTSIAGASGGPGMMDGPAFGARFNDPCGVAVDSNGNTYVADFSNHTIRKITASGNVSTYAGLPGVSGSADGPVLNARFYGPYGLAIDVVDNLYIADYRNSKIRKITPAGIVSTLSGGVSYPTSLAMRPDGSLVVTGFSTAVCAVSQSANVSVIAGSTSTEGSINGLGGNARFGSSLRGVAVDATGNIYVADAANRLIRKIDATYTVTTVAGIDGTRGTADGAAATATLHSPSAMAFDGAGNLIFSDSYANTIRKLTPGGVVSTVAGVANTMGYQDGAAGTATFRAPSSLVFTVDGTLIVADMGNDCIRKISPTWQTSTFAGKANYGSSVGTATGAKFYEPDGITVDRKGNIFVSDRSNNTIRRITPAGIVTTLAGQAGASGSADGFGAAARFNYPRGLTTNAAGDIFVADMYNHTIRKISPVGMVSTIAGLAGSVGNWAGVGSNARFNYPADVVADSAGVLYVANFYGNSISRIAPGGVVTNYASVFATGSAPFIPNSNTDLPIALAIQPDS